MDLDVQAGPSSTHTAYGLSEANFNPSIPSFQPALIARKMRKRKADSQDNDRLSKRLSLLNLERNGQKLYVPVESPQLKPTESPSLRQITQSDSMQLDDTHKVYIYDLDAELSDGDSDDGKLVFLPDIEKHLKQNRIPPSILANKDGELAGMQMILYSEPTSLTVPAEQDSVRRAIIEARARAGRKQRGEPEPEMETETSGDNASSSVMEISSVSPRRVQSGLSNLANDNPSMASQAMMNGSSWPNAKVAEDDDPDAMDMD